MTAQDPWLYVALGSIAGDGRVDGPRRVHLLAQASRTPFQVLRGNRAGVPGCVQCELCLANSDTAVACSARPSPGASATLAGFGSASHARRRSRWARSAKLCHVRAPIVGLIALAFGCLNVVVARRVPADDTDVLDRKRLYYGIVGIGTTAIGLITTVAALVGLLQH
jgi:hypothetical protein